MARYIVVRLESHESADLLLERFEPVESIQVVGMFASPARFCEGECDNDGRSVKSKKTGLRHCPVCRLPKASVMQQPRNLLQDPDLHPKFRDFFISVWEPFNNRPEEKYGRDAIDRTHAQVEHAGKRVGRAKRRRERRKN